ncbi:response regulator transcription factor [Indiicoccus explosivorum]|uniref:response regulator transcription factor n=1 Tax=Indiicoccus explosivorum TaxID=1917864 RepID=UPI000B45231D|nr:response regulator transcription factor [Indiicoccus explosivorum]
MGTRDRVLIVDDEWQMRNLLKVLLYPSFDAEEAEDGEEALALLKKKSFSLVILDLMMPGISGWEVCEKIREEKQVPILMLTARGDTKDKVEGFTAGADDYLVKPFEPEELVARVKALVRRARAGGQIETDVLEAADLKIDRTARLIYAGNTIVELTPKEFELVELLAVNDKVIFTRDMLMARIWETHQEPDIRTTDTHIKNIREKFRKGGLSFNPIRTVWGKGYRFQKPES